MMLIAAAVAGIVIVKVPPADKLTNGMFQAELPDLVRSKLIIINTDVTNQTFVKV